MGRPLQRTDRDDLENFHRQRNAICSHNFLKALHEHHGHMDAFIFEVDPPKVVLDEPPAPLPPIPNKEIAEAVKIAFPKYLSRVEAIQRATLTEYFGMTLFDLKGQRRTAQIVRARQVAMYVAKTMTLQSLPEIGRRFGNRDHTTVLHAVRKIERLLQSDAELTAEIERIKTIVPEAV